MNKLAANTCFAVVGGIADLKVIMTGLILPIGLLDQVLSKDELSLFQLRFDMIIGWDLKGFCLINFLGLTWIRLKYILDHSIYIL